MDTQTFDTLTTTFAQTHTRRRTVGAIGAVIAGLIGVAGQDTLAKKHKKKKQRAATCRDGLKNGVETDVDCGGGTCPRCANDKTCNVANDCASGTCTGGHCATCSITDLCGSDKDGNCQCNRDEATQQPVCHNTQALGLTVQSCDQCPAGTETCVTINGLLFNCYKRCGSA